MDFLSCFFCYQAPNGLGGHIGQFSLHLSHQGNRGFSLNMTKYLEIGPGGAIYLPYLLLHHTALSTQNVNILVTSLGLV